MTLGCGMMIPVYAGNCSTPATRSKVFCADEQNDSSNIMHRSITLPVSTIPYEGFLPNATWSNLAAGSPDRTSSITNGTSTTQLLMNYKNDHLCKGLQVLPTVYRKPQRASGGGTVTGVDPPTQERVRVKPHIPEEFLIKLPVSTARNRGDFVTEDVEVDSNTCAYMIPSCSIKENGCCKAGDQSDDGKRLEMSRSLMFKADVLLKEADSLLK
ncbi:hypothetical protein T265_09019 [Opisthorchis viverrini]|uniref:Uncharacterized protein n=1 Tax=Opisthorchis viverrini TaxID=6198 RepID=A0A074ZI69_OPIVI|nr:hypothetical protein T265_09019 [Opisthorchis viverrini]KER23010.1 hypothetical protein T265_09019 [Opisthorchis viverrini]